ncbi:DUF1292 domain-containing protein [Paenibacillus aurantius]|uniref:DUF1292 domain-containing protein n=1 Tax=Paenibacillus aurantius TaxID=2918900 RepID=A0AA96LHT1_9BACL|nr:DUF1292 domain-containing protein [Paenibacillus aurantius]WJH33120.1 DUF1292 domain-containing protein [Paenibacillus sp. CC-CFT747]WNQ13568.1 DUF1292 domain-containing protein [Paenibacillus aurantius]
MSDHKHEDNCGCGHDHEHEHEEDVFLVTDAEGKEHEMVMVYTFESESQAYAVLLDRNDPEADGVIFRIEEENDEAYLVSIEDDEEWNRVVAIYNEIAAEENDK